MRTCLWYREREIGCQVNNIYEEHKVQFSALNIDSSLCFGKNSHLYIYLFTKSRTEFYFVQHVAATYNTEICCARSCSCGGGNMGNKALQLAKQQCCATSCKEMLPVLLDLYVQRTNM